MVTKYGSTEQKTKDIIIFPLYRYHHFFFSFSNTFSSCLSLLTHSFWPTFSPPFLSNAACMAKLPKYLLYLSPSERYGFTIEMNLLWFFLDTDTSAIFYLLYLQKFRQDSTLPLVASVSIFSITVCLNEVNYICIWKYSLEILGIPWKLPRTNSSSLI